MMLGKAPLLDYNWYQKFQAGQDLTTLSTNTNGHSSRRLKTYRSERQEAFSRGGRYVFDHAIYSKGSL